MTDPELNAIELDATEDDDTAAELDDTEVDPAEGYVEVDGGYAGNDEALTGLCAGGPYHGRPVTSRFPRGFLLVDRPSALAWLYDWSGAAFVFRSEAPLDEDGRWRAAEEAEFDVIAYDSEQVPR